MGERNGHATTPGHAFRRLSNDLGINFGMLAVDAGPHYGLRLALAWLWPGCRPRACWCLQIMSGCRFMISPISRAFMPLLLSLRSVSLSSDVQARRVFLLVISPRRRIGSSGYLGEGVTWGFKV